jgi:hypothetical protein
MAIPPKPRVSVTRTPYLRRTYGGMMSDDFLDGAANELYDEIARGRIDRD